ncbi:DUF3307 domain-containing protein [Maribacter polysaccharolyticus]|uniref:DUF3307 domain-containing protein n=1 Tax=Maribacter polysaccharolyticus TaxID=3020831 RepID=UPI00237F669F|nr:DUF3307 domain-containing protein [Maribacter polysaccharolyticus]MDE3740708.1 DUF3307 domain-containing protein [Maribacter polysaccharolyticus]
MLFTKLLLAHLIGDFLVQPQRWVIHKESNRITSRYLYLHILLHAVLMLLLVWDLSYWRIIVVITVSHYMVDLAKLYANPLFKNKAVPFFIDQVLHVIVLYVCVYHENLYGHTMGLLQLVDWPLVTAVIFVGYPAAIIMGMLLEGMSRKIEIDHKSLPNAGKYIGIIERLFVLVFIILGRWEAIGLLITAKSVFRFNDLKERNNRKLTEYILIGTLLSFGLAIITGIVYIAFKP